MTEITGEALGIAGFALAQAVHAWAFAREGAHRLVDSEEAADVITVDFCQHHRWRQVARPYGSALMVDRVRQGISDHPEAERLWRYWE
jgi:hypothetical protein